MPTRVKVSVTASEVIRKVGDLIDLHHRLYEQLDMAHAPNETTLHVRASETNFVEITATWYEERK